MTKGIERSSIKGAELIEEMNILIEENFQSDDLSVKISELEEQLMEVLKHFSGVWSNTQLL